MNDKEEENFGNYDKMSKDCLKIRHKILKNYLKI
jgi:hypothetical protein